MDNGGTNLVILYNAESKESVLIDKKYFGLLIQPDNVKFGLWLERLVGERVVIYNQGDIVGIIAGVSKRSLTDEKLDSFCPILK